jgi:hypothetical protein
MELLKKMPVDVQRRVLELCGFLRWRNGMWRWQVVIPKILLTFTIPRWEIDDDYDLSNNLSNLFLSSCETLGWKLVCRLYQGKRKGFQHAVQIYMGSQRVQYRRHELHDTICGEEITTIFYDYKFPKVAIE